MTDLYDEAAAVPRILRGAGRAQRVRDLPDSRRAIQWARAKGRVVSPFHGTYVSAPGTVDLLDHLHAAALILPPAAVLTHHTAALLHGFGVVPADAVHVALPAGVAMPRRQGITAHAAVLPFDDVREIFGLPVLAPARCAVDLARTLPRPDALAVLDAALRAEACTVDDLTAEVERHERLRGVRRARELVCLATPFAECRQESHLRLVLHDARLPRPVPQLTVVDECGVARCRIDLAYEEEQVGVEYDGVSHLDRHRMRDDRQRHNWLETRGWRMRYFTDIDLYRTPLALVTTVRRALGARRSRATASTMGKSTWF
jgi:very-short-patch-repair endonuclease